MRKSCKERQMKKQYDLTSGGILQKLVLVALPIMGTQLMQMLYNLTDMFWLGRLSSDDVAASGIAGMYLWLGMALLLFGRMGAEIGVSQNKGRGDMEAANAFARNALFISLVLGVLYGSLLTFASGPLVSVFDVRELHVADAAMRYMSIIGLGIPPAYMAAALTGTFNGSGNSRVPFFASAVGLVVNIILDPLMIFTMGLGIQGAAIATVIAQWIVFGLLIWAVKKHKERPFERFSLLTKPNRDKVKQIFLWSYPVALESGLFTLLSMTVTRLLTAFGSDALAVSRVGSQIESLSWLIGGGFGTAVTAFIGQNYGAGQWNRIRKGFRLSSLAMLIWGAVITLAMFFGGYVLFGLFLPEYELRTMGAVYLRVLSYCQIVACLEVAGAGLFRGTGRTVPPSMVSIISNVLRVPLCYWLASTSLGMNGVWWGITITAALRGAVIFVWAFADLSRKKRTEHAA